MIEVRAPLFILHTDATTYLFRINEEGHLEHLYYGRKITVPSSIDALVDKHTTSLPFAVSYQQENPAYHLSNVPFEYSFYGKGDDRSSALLFSEENTNQVHDFIYKDHRIIKGKPRSFSGLPESYGDKESATTLVVVLQERYKPITLELRYTTFDESNVITRRAALINETQQSLYLHHFSSMQLDLLHSDYSLVSFDGPWGREREMHTTPLTQGKIVKESQSGISSSSHNPALFLTTKEGECYGTQLMYSGDYTNSVEVSPYGKTRLLSGFNRSTFRWKLPSGEKLYTPEAVLTFSHEGLDQASAHFHHFINNHVIRRRWKNHQRPILFNSFRSCGYDYNESTLLNHAKKARELGIELFVLDEGWFGSRSDESTSLGDWMVNTKKLPNGLAHLSAKLHQMDMMFGLVVEPELVNLKSLLYEQHPEWLVQLPDRQPSSSKERYFLDLTKQEVQDYIFDHLSSIFTVSQVDFVSWRLSRTFSDMYSSHPSFNQGEFNHRYTLALYALLERFVTTFPHILFESDTSRFDLGMMCYVSQLRVSGATDPLSVHTVVDGTSYAYPLSLLSHRIVDSPDRHSLRSTSMNTRLHVASFGVLGFDLDITRLSSKQKKAIQSHIEYYKFYRSLFQYGVMYHLKASDQHTMWVVSTEDHSEMLVLYFQHTSTLSPPSELLRLPMADPTKTYQVVPKKEHLDIELVEPLLDAVSPFRLKSDGVLQQLVKERSQFESEVEYYEVGGDLLAYRGISLNQQFGSGLYDRQTRVIGDVGSRLYHLKAIEPKA